jgi:predicted dehydrogenase
MSKVRTIVVGTGGFSRCHIRAMIEMKRVTTITGFVEPSEASRKATAAVFTEKKLSCPPFFATVKELVKAQGPADTAVICSPHKFHFENAKDCLESGMDVMIEKPMVMNGEEARRLIKLRDTTGRLVMVAFPGSLSPAVWKAKDLIARGAIGEVSTISAYAHQHWKKATIGSWRQIPEISGGGFLFDTGSHMVNTVVDLLGSEVTRVSALLDNRGTPVEINSSVSGMSANGITFSLAGAGDTIQCCSQILVFGSEGVLKTGIWGESLSVKKAADSDYQPVAYPKSRGPWEQFLRVRSGKMKNPCPPEVGLRFAALMDMIRQSAKTGKTISAKR